MVPFYHLPIRWKITIFTFGIVLFSILMGAIILIGNMVELRINEMGNRSLLTARVVAQLPEIKREIGKPNGSKVIQPIVEKIRIINDDDYIVVMDMNRIRYADPSPSKIGTKFEGEDAGPAFAEHTYTSQAKGEIGISVRSFTPIMNDDLEQVGVVMVGNILPSIWEIILSVRGDFYLTITLSLVFGVWGSWLLASHIKRQTFQLEPHELARVLDERTATFHAIHEGVIAIDQFERITVMNQAAKNMLKIHGDPIGKPIREAIPETRLPEVLELGHPLYHREFYIGDTLIVSSRIPIRVDDKTVGAVAIFQDKTEVTQLAEELTGVKAFVDALRVQNHEHMNKLHTIAGLIQLGNMEKALEYVFQVTEEQEEVTQFLAKHIHDHSISGLLLGKISRGKELGIFVKVDKESKLHQIPESLDHHDLVLIIGNLIENAFDSYQGIQRNHKIIFVRIDQDPEQLTIIVEDNGKGMDSFTKKHMFEKGFSTKKTTGRGIGLFLVHEKVLKANGNVYVESEPGEGTTITITFPMSRERREAYV
ncbi:sensor histidine kinase [Microaerobacter geothermalis]|uniref:ATP-binding protein n=1 Tax=Microaerobacter geothermalis TaxID=674972 RepID=UPI001F1C0AFF|nr:sensor histidine kinase [Microaerobacter geothermalis]MCF6092986.1 sensor histidine kinase [Microaerobacter geothermalis]